MASLVPTANLRSGQLQLQFTISALSEEDPRDSNLANGTEIGLDGFRLRIAGRSLWRRHAAATHPACIHRSTDQRDCGCDSYSSNPG